MVKWIKFNEVGDTGKTKIFEVRSLDGDFLLGKIKWFGRWRKYSFFPEPNTVFEQDCLMDIYNYLLFLMNKRKEVG